MGKLKLVSALLILVATGFGISADWTADRSRIRMLWQEVVTPGSLSRSHVFLADNCVSCHAPVAGVKAALCISCHADNTALLQRQATAFHAQLQVCTGCHLEHQGGERAHTVMDHALLAKSLEHEEGAARKAAWWSADATPALGGTSLRTWEASLNCSGCHATKDRHRGFFGDDCFQCHDTSSWAIAEYRHPSPRSTECAQCHQQPPSHNMMHFSMVSARIARQPGAKVNQCFRCHQTTAWNDIKGAGWVKHH